MMDIGSCIIRNETKSKLPSLPFVSIKDYILGPKYELSICFITEDKQKKINKKYRKINKTTNVLSFPLTKNTGEITFDIKKLKKDAVLFDMKYPQFLKYLFIHGCLHLKGFKHSSTMEKEEEKILKKFS